jgi:hypothetical protein
MYPLFRFGLFTPFEVLDQTNWRTRLRQLIWAKGSNFLVYFLIMLVCLCSWNLLVLIFFYIFIYLIPMGTSITNPKQNENEQVTQARKRSMILLKIC